MKTLFKSLFVALALVASVASFSEAKPIGRPTGVAAYKVGMFTAADGKLVILLDKELGGYVDIRLKAANGTVLYSQHLGKKDLKTRMKWNLSELTDGQYQLEITNGLETKTHSITLTTPQPTTPTRTVAMN